MAISTFIFIILVHLNALGRAIRSSALIQSRLSFFAIIGLSFFLPRQLPKNFPFTELIDLEVRCLSVNGKSFGSIFPFLFKDNAFQESLIKYPVQENLGWIGESSLYFCEIAHVGAGVSQMLEMWWMGYSTYIGHETSMNRGIIPFEMVHICPVELISHSRE